MWCACAFVLHSYTHSRRHLLNHAYVHAHHYHSCLSSILKWIVQFITYFKIVLFLVIISLPVISSSIHSDLSSFLVIPPFFTPSCFCAHPFPILHIYTSLLISDILLVYRVRFIMIKEETVLLKVRLFRADVVERRYYSTALVVYSLCFIFSFYVIHSNPGWVRGFIYSVVSEVLLTRLSPGFVKPVVSGVAGCPDDSVVLLGWVRRPAINLGVQMIPLVRSIDAQCNPGLKPGVLLTRLSPGLLLTWLEQDLRRFLMHRNWFRLWLMVVPPGLPPRSSAGHTIHWVMVVPPGLPPRSSAGHTIHWVILSYSALNTIDVGRFCWSETEKRGRRWALFS